ALKVSDHPPLHTPPLAHSQGARDRSAMLKGADIVFDLDGTLVDTAPDLTSALNHALTRHLGVSAATVRSAVGLGIRVMIEETLRRLGASDDVDEMLAKFLAYYEANIARESWPFPGVVVVLERLAAEGATLAVCTNKQERPSRLLLQELDLEDYFSAISGRDTFPVSKPNPVISSAHRACRRRSVQRSHDR